MKVKQIIIIVILLINVSLIYSQQSDFIYNSDHSTGSLTLTRSDCLQTGWSYGWDMVLPYNAPANVKFSLNTSDYFEIYTYNAITSDYQTIWSGYGPYSSSAIINLPDGSSYCSVYCENSTSLVPSTDVFSINYNTFSLSKDLMISGDLKLNGSISGNQAGGALQVKTDYGYVNIGPLNGPTWAHIYTDMPKFIFNKPIHLITGEFSAYNTSNMSLQTNSTTRMTILSTNGNVGIATAAPATPLHVKATDRLGLVAGNSLPLTRTEGNGGTYNLYLVNDFLYRETAGCDWTTASYMRGISIDVSFMQPNTLRSWIKQNPSKEKIEFGSSGNTFMSVGSSVGIGTTDPKAKLDVGAFIGNGQIGTVFGRLSEGNTTGDGTYLGVAGYSTSCPTGTYSAKSFSIEHHFYGQTNSSINFYRGGSMTGGFITFNTTNNTERMRIDEAGNVGIGTTTPNGNLEVASSAGGVLAISTNTINGSSSAPLYPKLDFLGYANGNKARITTTEETYNTHGSKFSILVNNGDSPTSLVERFTILPSGKVGIGINKITTDALLTVNGIIQASEVRVSLDGLADYVFDGSYKLMPLKQVESYVKTNSRLPEMPSASEVSKNGLSMGEMQNKLLQKVEELTLYVIEQQKQIDELKKELKK